MKLYNKSCNLQDFSPYTPYFAHFRVKNDLGKKQLIIGYMCECGYYHQHVLMRDCRKERCRNFEEV